MSLSSYFFHGKSPDYSRGFRQLNFYLISFDQLNFYLVLFQVFEFMFILDHFMFIFVRLYLLFWVCIYFPIYYPRLSCFWIFLFLLRFLFIIQSFCLLYEVRVYSEYRQGILIIGNWQFMFILGYLLIQIYVYLIMYDLVFYYEGFQDLQFLNPSFLF